MQRPHSWFRLQTSSNSSNKEEQEIKPIIIDDIQTAPNSPKIDKQNETDTNIPSKYPQINQNYTQPVMRPPQDPKIH